MDKQKESCNIRNFFQIFILNFGKNFLTMIFMSGVDLLFKDAPTDIIEN